MLIRDAINQDRVYTNKIVSACWDKFYRPLLGDEKVNQMNEDRKNNPRTTASPGTLVAEEKGEVIGFCFFKDCELVALYVNPDLTSRGIGAALIQEAVKRMRSTCPVIKTSTLRGNERALKFYKREGFEEVGFGTHTFRGVTMPTIRLEMKH